MENQEQQNEALIGGSGLNAGLGRKFSPLMLKVWGDDIRRAEGLVNGDIPSGGTDSGYVIELDPEDFLDLCAGKWHEPNPNLTR